MRSWCVFRIFLLVLFSFVGTIVAFGQVVKYNYEVKLVDKKNEERKISKRVYLAHSMNLEKIKSIYGQAKQYKDEYSLESHRRELGFKSSANGKFQFPGINGMGVVVNTEDGDLIFFTHDDGNWQGKIKGEGYRVNCKSTGVGEYTYEVIIDDNQATSGDVNVDGENKFQGVPPRNIDLRDGYDRFECHLAIPDSFLAHSARIIIRPYAIDCQTEDTIAYLKPAAYEGRAYHSLQNKRKAFDYAVYDPVGMSYEVEEIQETVDTIRVLRTTRDRVTLTDANGNELKDEDGFRIDTMVTRTEMRDSLVISVDTVLVKRSGFIKSIDSLKHEQGMVKIDTVILFRRPIKAKRNRGLIRYSIEDYHHVMESYSGFEPGTCLTIDPFKFLEMSTAMNNFDLRPEFYEVADETPTSINEEIPIQFYYNTANIIEDSVYMVSIRKLEHDMRDIQIRGGVLTNAVLTAYASPDGSAATNLSLAGRRAQAARGKINPPRGTSIEVKPVIDSWQHTAELLDKEGYAEEAQMVRNALASTSDNNQAAERIIKASANYQNIIKPILEKQCRITFTYQFFSERKLEPEEAVEYYYKDKHRLFSNGDYFNLFSAITDSLELDTLTEIAYERVIAKNKDYEAPIAPYIINRKAVLNAKQGVLDSTVLQPLIKEKVFSINYVTDGDAVKYNRPEILLNQAVLFFQLQEIGRAQMFVNRLKRANYNDSSLEKLEKFMKFQELYQIAPDRRTQRQQADFRAALSFVENSGPDNKAVLYTEFDGLKKQETEAWEYVHLMDDSNPRKWYLMGILWALRDGKEYQYPLPSVDDLSMDDADNVILSEDDERIMMEQDSVWYETYLVKKEAAQKAIEARKEELKQMDADDADVNIEGIPYYIAYFWKSFDLERERLKQSGIPENELDIKNIYLKYYLNEGYVSEKMRKKKNHAYMISRIPAYKKLFRLRKILDDKERAGFRKVHQLDDGPEELEIIDQTKESEEQNANEEN